MTMFLEEAAKQVTIAVGSEMARISGWERMER